MGKKPNVTANVPEADVPRQETEEAEITPEEQARRRRFYEKALALRGKIHLNIDIDELRGRRRR